MANDQDEKEVQEMKHFKEACRQCESNRRLSFQELMDHPFLGGNCMLEEWEKRYVTGLAMKRESTELTMEDVAAEQVDFNI